MYCLFVCFNPISYHIAQEVIRRERLPRSLVLYESRRFGRHAGALGRHLAIHARSHLLIHAMARLGLVSKVYQPHMRVTTRRLIKALAHVPEVHYLDDGLDTLRHRPRNFDIQNILPGSRYYTFSEYPSLPHWLSGLDVQRVGRLSDYVASFGTGVAFPPGRHVLIESPGVDVCTIASQLALDSVVPIVVTHPVPDKRGPLPAVKADRWDGSGHLDADMAASVGVHFHIGETMSLVAALFQQTWDKNSWHVHLSSQQRGNLVFSELLAPNDLSEIT